tara:strand:- start:1631 stop:2422 length:792 start_codon:yes stop_codon:yes gene_type:complete
MDNQERIDIENIQKPVSSIDDLYIVYTNNILNNVFCNYIINNYNTTKNKTIRGITYVNPSNNDSSEEDVVGKKEFVDIKWVNDEYLETIKNTLYNIAVNYEERIYKFYNTKLNTGTYLNDISTFSYTNNDTIDYNSITLLNISDYEYYFERSLNTWPISYEIINKNTKIEIESDNIMIKKDVALHNSVRVILFLNNVDDGYLIFDKFKTSIEAGKIIIFQNNFLFNYEICTTSNVHIVTLQIISQKNYQKTTNEKQDITFAYS